jgi:hypothetical protein
MEIHRECLLVEYLYLCAEALRFAIRKYPNNDKDIHRRRVMQQRPADGFTLGEGHD